MHKVVRTATISPSINVLLRGQLAYLGKYYDLVAVASDLGDSQHIVKREKVRFKSVPMQRAIAPLNDLLSLYKLYKFFKREKPSIVHSITPKAGLLSMLAARMAGVPIRMHTFTGLIFPTRTGAMQKLLIIMDRLLCLSATHIFPEGLGVKRDLEKYRITSKPLKVLGNGNVNGIDLEYFNPEVLARGECETLRDKLGIQDSDFVYIFVGRLVTDKGINELIAAFKKVQSNTNRSVKLLLVGSYEHKLDPLLPDTLKAVKHNRSIISVGFQDDVRPYFAIADALSFPSYREGFPNVVMQALAMGLPAIVTDINGCNEIVSDGENGTIIRVRDVEMLYQTMMRLMIDDEYYRHVKANTRQSIVSRFSHEVIWSAVYEAYESAIQMVEVKVNTSSIHNY